VHPVDLQHNTNAVIVQNSVSKNVYETSSIKRLQDLLTEEQSDSHSLYSGTTEFGDEDFEVFLKKLKTFFESSCIKSLMQSSVFYFFLQFLTAVY